MRIMICIMAIQLLLLLILTLPVAAAEVTASADTVWKSKAGADAFVAAYDGALAQWPTPYESIYVPTRFGSTHVIVTGSSDNPPLVLLHAAGTSSTVWKRNIQAFSQAYRVYLVDILGDANKSVYTQPLRSTAEVSEWLLAVLDEFHIQQTHIAGLSWGGWMALQLAQDAPQRLKSVVLLAPAASLAPMGWPFYVHFLGPMLIPTRGMVNNTFRWLSAGKVVDDLLAEQMYLAIKHFRFPKGQYPTVFTDEQLSSVSVPTLLLIGDREVIYNPRTAIDRAHRLIPGVEAELVASAGHLLIMEQAEYVNECVLRFLGQHDTAMAPVAM